ncbi:hypothetical protein [Rhizobium sp. CF142]|uniref:hypothetical protein n=1 Tax=Rhizobium sp. CF142 TaxID=1144314 RepID=UPI00055E6D7B|nr:hypothetical protein [Rhizobium sp. CF142]
MMAFTAGQSFSIVHSGRSKYTGGSRRFFEPQSVVSNRGRDAVRVYVRGDVSGKPWARWADGRIEFEYGPRVRERIF